MEYKASLDKTSKVITISVLILFVAIGQMSVRELLSANGDLLTIVIHVFVLLQFVLIFMGSWLYAPKAYTIDENLNIVRPAGILKVKLTDITEVRLLEEKEMKGTLRTFGVGGLFGYFGKFSIPRIGSTSFYATQMRNYTLVTTRQGKKMLLTPDDASMIQKIKHSIASR